MKQGAIFVEHGVRHTQLCFQLCSGSSHLQRSVPEGLGCTLVQQILTREEMNRQHATVYRATIQRSRWNLSVNFQRQASLRSGTAESRATADRSSSNCSFSFTTADTTISCMARSRSHHGRTNHNSSTKIHCEVQLTPKEQERDLPDQTQKGSVNAIRQSTEQSSSLLGDQTRQEFLEKHNVVENEEFSEHSLVFNWEMVPNVHRFVEVGHAIREYGLE